MKDKEINSVDQLFRGGLADGESTPPSASWAQMEALLDTLPEKKKRRPVVIWWSMAAAILPLLVLSVWWFGESGSQQAPVVAQTPVVKVMPAAPSKTEVVPSEIKTQEVATLETSPKASRNSQTGNEIGESQRIKRVSDKNTENGVSPSLAAENPIATTQDNNPPISPESIVMQEKSTQVMDNGPEDEVASIEIRHGKPSEPAEAEVATIEWRPHQEKRPTLSEQFNKLRHGELNIPSVGEAKENLFALLTR